MDRTLTWLKELAETPGVSGYEQRVRTLLRKRLDGMAEIAQDNMGCIIFRKTGACAAPKIMLASHMDEIGFMVKHITKEGFLKFTTIGGWWEQVMLGQRVTVMTGKGDLHGVIGSKPPHILSAEERKKLVEKKDMYIDIGVSSEQEARDFGVRPGDAVAPFGPFAVMANDKFLLAKAWDNRIGCAVMVEVLETLQLKKQHPNTIYGVGTVQEEVGTRGAKTSAELINPDIAIAIDTCVAGDTPGVTEDQSTAKLGQGVGICIFDASMIPHIRLRDFAIATAEENHIPYQLHFSEGGGTDAGRIHIHHIGVPSLVLSIPTRYIHSHNSVIHRDDYDAAVRLLVAMFKKLDQARCKELQD